MKWCLSSHKELSQLLLLYDKLQFSLTHSKTAFAWSAYTIIAREKPAIIKRAAFRSFFWDNCTFLIKVQLSANVCDLLSPNHKLWLVSFCISVLWCMTCSSDMWIWVWHTAELVIAIWSSLSTVCCLWDLICLWTKKHLLPLVKAVLRCEYIQRAIYSLYVNTIYTFISLYTVEYICVVFSLVFTLVSLLWKLPNQSLPPPEHFLSLTSELKLWFL